MELDKSILMQKQVKDNSEDLQSEFLDLKNWEEQMKRKEQELLNERTGQKVLPPIRSRNKKKCMIKESKKTENSKRIKSYDYASWEKFDIDKACKELDEDEQSNDSSDETMSKEELEKDHSKALEHKNQGNIFVQQKKWDKAIASYSEAIKIFPYDAIFYANRALCYLKQDNLYSAEADCSSAIQLDKTYVKAYHRRATARIELKQYKEAKEDIEKMLTLEPSNKEAKTLLSQINKRLENLKPIIISGEDTAKNIPMEKKIAEKMFDNVKSNKEIIDIKEDKNKKNSVNNVGAIAKSTTVSLTESKRDSRIPDWLLEKDDVAVVEPIEKPPHLRSKEPLIRIPVQEADLTKPYGKGKHDFLLEKEIKASCNNNQHQELLNIEFDNTKHKENITKPKPEANLIENMEISPIPKTAVQFVINWRRNTSSDLRYRYLKQIPSNNLSKIFQDSMESDIFSDILAILKTEFMKRKEPIFLYLKNLSDVKRFRALIMFISNIEKQDLKLMFSYCKTSEKISEEEVTELQNKYEI
ncbi:RNA polymerase II-associated protein 3 [Formica exsecta]|uniref:RNA polymerase II-associated protein 3 n=1 Tax=Formica exsecta TaxID=72781 RepID=UPI001142A885|nr:RNA polymerase II-associated protein 3 [Formica exsecta]